MTIPLDQQITLAGQIWLPALKEMKRATNKRMSLNLSDEDLLAIASFACCKLAVETHGVGAFDRVRALVDELQARVNEQHRASRS